MKFRDLPSNTDEDFVRELLDERFFDLERKLQLLGEALEILASAVELINRDLERLDGIQRPSTRPSQTH